VCPLKLVIQNTMVGLLVLLPKPSEIIGRHDKCWKWSCLVLEGALDPWFLAPVARTFALTRSELKDKKWAVAGAKQGLSAALLPLHQG
jgi:hypothetical protein